MTKAILTAQRTSSNEQTKATNIAVFASSMAHELQNYLQAALLRSFPSSPLLKF